MLSSLLFYTLLFLDLVGVSDLNKNLGGSTDLAKLKKARVGGFAYPYSNPPCLQVMVKGLKTRKDILEI